MLVEKVLYEPSHLPSSLRVVMCELKYLIDKYMKRLVYLHSWKYICSFQILILFIILNLELMRYYRNWRYQNINYFLIAR